MFDLFWDLRQEASIRAAHTATARAEGNAERLRTEVNLLESRIDRLTMIAAAMWTLLQKHSGLSDEDLAQRVQEIDLSDGRLDGQVRRTAASCRACNRAISPRHMRCIYCGEATASNTQPFDAVM